MNIPYFGRAHRSVRLRPAHDRSGFSLIEVTLALGIVAFAMIPLFALLPVGLNIYKQSMDSTVTTQISQKLMNELQQADFDTLLATAAAASNKLPARYFDVEGNEMPAKDYKLAIYWANISLSTKIDLPDYGDNAGNRNTFTQDMASVLIQIANNPGGRPITTGSAAFYNPELKTAAWNLNTGIPLFTYSGLIARNTKR